MGALCSKSGTLEGGHRVVGTTRTLGGEGGGGKDSIPVNPRQAALDAAERRRQTVRSSLAGRRWAGLKLTGLGGQELRRGTNEANPNAGQLSSQLAAKNASKGAEVQQAERLVVSTRLMARLRLAEDGTLVGLSTPRLIAQIRFDLALALWGLDAPLVSVPVSFLSRTLFSARCLYSVV